MPANWITWNYHRHCEMCSLNTVMCLQQTLTLKKLDKQVRNGLLSAV